MNRRRPAPDFREESASLATLYGHHDATDDREAGRQQSTRARRLGALVATAHRRELDASEREELGLLMAGNPTIEDPK